MVAHGRWRQQHPVPLRSCRGQAAPAAFDNIRGPVKALQEGLVQPLLAAAPWWPPQTPACEGPVSRAPDA